MATKSLVAILLFFACGAGPQIYVSPTGDDANPGSADQPLATISRAREVVRTLNSNMQSDITVYLAGGNYTLTEPLLLDPADSGTNGHNVIYASLPNQNPILTGSIRIVGWKRIDPKKNLWATTLPVDLDDARQMFVDGVRCLRARGRCPVKLTQIPTGYTADSDVFSHWRNPSSIEFVYTGGNTVFSETSTGLGPWTEPRCPVAAISGKTISMAQPCWNNCTRRALLTDFNRTANLVGPPALTAPPEYIENAYELLGTPGQWYFDPVVRRIYYTPRAGEDMATADVEVPVLETLIKGTGTPTHPIHNIIFKGLQFSFATWLAPDSPEGFSEIQTNFRVTGDRGFATQGLADLAPGGTQPFGCWTKTPGNISFAYDQSISFQDDAFVHLGAVALDLGDGSQGDTVQGCIFDDVSANGMQLGDVDLPQATGNALTRDNTIANNRFYEVADEYHGGVGLWVGYTQRTTIKHNQFDHLPYSAISIGWGGWLDKIRRPGVSNNSTGNIIADNLIYQDVLLLADGGGIYTQGLTGPTLADGEKITGNVLRDQFGSGYAIYTDNGCSNVTASGNVIFHTNHNNWGTRHKDYYNGADGSDWDALDFENNYWQQGEPDSSLPNVTLAGNHLISSLDQAPPQLLNTTGLEPQYRPILQRHFARSTTTEPPMRVAAFAGNAFAYVTWNPPIIHGARVKTYTVTSNRGDQVTITSDDFWAQGYVKLTGLQNGLPYTFTVTDTNDIGPSPPSMPSLPVTPMPPTSPLSPPPAPTDVSAAPSDRAATIFIRHHVDDKDPSSPIMVYAITSHPGDVTLYLMGRTVLTFGGSHFIFFDFNGLENGKSYTFDVSAISAAGTSPAATTDSVTPGQ